MTNEEYHADTSRISKSGLDKIAKSPAHYYAKYLDPNRDVEKRTDALVIGTAVHSAILEPDDFKSRYATIDDTKIVNEIGGAKPRSTSKYKEWYAEQLELIGNKEIIAYSEFNYCDLIRSKVRQHPTAGALLASGYAEQTFHFEEPISGAPCKFRPDWLNMQNNVIVDIKTTDDASPRRFARSVEKYRYHVQDAFYSDGLYHSQGIQIDGFVFIAVEKQAPYNVGVYVLPEGGTQRGRELYQENCIKYMECRKSGIWPGYSDQIEELKLSQWATSENI